MLRDALMLIAGLALIIKGGDLFVSAAVRVAEFLRMPRVVIGSTLVSLATTMPELVVSIMAGAKGESELAVGNAVGSCICNIGLILGATAAFKHIDVNPRELRSALLAMFAAGLLLFLLTLDLSLARWQGILLMLLGAAYFAHDFRQHRRDTDPEDIAEARAIEQERVTGRSWLHTRSGTAAVFLFGAVLVVFGSKLLVESAVDLARAIGIPSIIIGLTVVAIGTSLPEFVTAITSSRQNVSDLAIGNVLGANIANLTFVVGAAAAIHEVTLSRATQLFNFPALLVVMLLALWVILSENRVTRREGAVLLVAYAVYLGAVIIMAAAIK